MYVLDTNTLIYFFKGIGNVADHLLNKAPHTIGIPSIVMFELEVGIAKSTSPDKRRRQLDHLISIVNLLPFNLKEAGAASKIRVDLEKKGTTIGPYDILIAGTALSHQGILVTHNITEFERVKGLQVEDWY